jgi:hypothetical protein
MQFTLLTLLCSAASSFSLQCNAPLHPSMDSTSNDPFTVEWYDHRVINLRYKHFVVRYHRLHCSALHSSHSNMDYTSNGTKPIQWTLGANVASKHKIVSIILSKLELGNIVSYCLTVMHKIAAFVGNKINALVGNHSANRFASHINVFPRTLWLPHVTT